MIALLLKVSRTEQRSVTSCFRWVKGRRPIANAIQSEMCPCDKCFTCFNVWCKKFAHGHKVLLMRYLIAWSPCCFDDQCNDLSSRFSQKNLYDTLINVTLMFDD